MAPARIREKFRARMAAAVMAVLLLPWNGLFAAIDSTGEFCSAHGADCRCPAMCRRKATPSEGQPAAHACRREGAPETPQRQSCAAHRCESGGDAALIADNGRFFLISGRFLPARASDSIQLPAVGTAAPAQSAHAPPVPPPQA